MNQRPTTIHLIEVGSVPAIPLAQVRPGDVLMWNFGLTEEVVSVKPKGKQSIRLTTRCTNERYCKPVEEHSVTKRASTLVARVRAPKCQFCGTKREMFDQFCAECGGRISA